MTKEEFAKELTEHFATIGDRSEKENNLIVDGWEELFPHAEISDLIFWPFMEMSYSEIAEEVFLREALWKDWGDPAVRERIRQQAMAALANESTPEYGRYSAEDFLRSDTDIH